MTDLDTLRTEHAGFVAAGLSLNMERGVPGNDNFDLSLPLITAIDADDILSDGGVDIRSYPGGVLGLAEARALFATQLRVSPEQILVGGNSSLELMSSVLSRALLSGVKGSEGPWFGQGDYAPALIVTVPGYDRHFTLAESLGYRLVPVSITPGGPNMDEVERLVAEDASIKGIYFVPTYSNPTGDTLSQANAKRLVSMTTAAHDFTIFADDAYAVHHLSFPPPELPSLLTLAQEAGNPDRVILFGSTSKVTFAGGGVALMATSASNLAHWAKVLGTQTIGPNKLEQWRHVRFFQRFEGGIQGLMQEHAKLLKPKFDAVQSALHDRLGNRELASWTLPGGGYFVTMTTARPVADRVVALAKEAGVSLTPPGATHPGGVDPGNCVLRLAPTKPPLGDVQQAMQVVACCVELASAEFDAT